MRIFTVLFLLCIATLTATAQRVEEKVLAYSDNVDFRVKWFQDVGTSQGGFNPNNPIYTSGKGQSFKICVVEFTNTSKEDQIINFNDFAVVDNQNKKYSAKYANQVAKISDTSSDLQLKLKAGKTKSFMVEF